MQIKFTVYARPQPQGSMRAFNIKGRKAPIVTSDNKSLKPYRQAVSEVALLEMRANGLQMIERKQRVVANFKFYLAKPKSKPKKCIDMVTKPDLSKLVRSTEDSLTGIVYEDDSQIVNETSQKEYGVPERVEIWVYSGVLDVRV